MSWLHKFTRTTARLSLALSVLLILFVPVSQAHELPAESSDKDLWSTQFAAAQEDLKIGDKSEALVHLNKAIEWFEANSEHESYIAANHAYTVSMRGVLLLNFEGRIPEAIDAFYEASKLYTPYKENLAFQERIKLVLEFLAEALVAERRYPEVLNVAEEGISLFPSNIGPTNCRLLIAKADASFALGLYLQASVSYGQAYEVLDQESYGQIDPFPRLGDVDHLRTWLKLMDEIASVQYFGSSKYPEDLINQYKVYRETYPATNNTYRMNHVLVGRALSQADPWGEGYQILRDAMAGVDETDLPSTGIIEARISLSRLAALRGQKALAKSDLAVAKRWIDARSIKHPYTPVLKFLFESESLLQDIRNGILQGQYDIDTASPRLVEIVGLLEKTHTGTFEEESDGKQLSALDFYYFLSMTRNFLKVIQLVRENGEWIDTPDWLLPDPTELSSNSTLVKVFKLHRLLLGEEYERKGEHDLAIKAYIEGYRGNAETNGGKTPTTSSVDDLNLLLKLITFVDDKGDEAGWVRHAQNGPLAAQAESLLKTRRIDDTSTRRALLTATRKAFEIHIEQRWDAAPVFFEKDRMQNGLSTGPSTLDSAMNSAFVSAQLGQQSGASTSALLATERFASTTPKLAAMLRRYQDIGRRLNMLELSSSRTSRLQSTIEKLRAEETTLLSDIKSLAPEYAETNLAQSVTEAAISNALDPDEAVVMLFQANETLHIWVIGKENVIWAVSHLPMEEINTLSTELLKSAQSGGQISFPYDAAEALHDALFKPLVRLQDDAAGKQAPIKRVTIVAEGALAAFPFGLLRGYAPDGKRDYSSFLSSYSTPPIDPTQMTSDDRIWFGELYAIKHATSLANWMRLKQDASSSNAENALWAMANPPLAQLTSPQTTSVSVLASLGTTEATDICSLPTVPATQRIAKTMYDNMQGKRDLLLGAAASEAAIRKASQSGKLKKARVVAFNTHAVMAGELGGVARDEPAIIVSPPYACDGKPPQAPIAEDNDGFLTASEIFELELDADWVLLTACNTAASDGTPNGAPLSGLASGFFYAGARSLLVSHWPALVSDDPAFDGPTELLIEELFASHNQGVTKSEALRRAQVKVREIYPHPAHWATFSIVGQD